MAEIMNNDLVVEILRSIQADGAETRRRLGAMEQQLINIRQQLHDLRGEMLQLEEGQATIRIDIDRIKRRLQLVEAD